jgi:hypothetical protein
MESQYNFDEDKLSQDIYDSIIPHINEKDKGTLLIQILGVIKDIFDKNPSINPDTLMKAIEAVIDIIIPKLDLPFPQIITRKLAKNAILKTIKPIIYGN